ncbi:biotin--[acetyl-CoA-carboxylase] ligase [Legionella waltersii]|uniref:Bifunctional ligase/repressor BirA n=1 Tax=Legionella waltersii TaxID=66969 RepID=A0A0W1AND6_9GAMM|nr:biotin--[acetyl-CoA-carboxylase] ligase [Legionella waltersii]KTD82770.1 biotin-[acetylCoA carboxylase] holoenzyme synthetase and biotin operon repressor [Legionella waltersii]SNV01206.1 biotin-[acetylCoA carboxylase] holoenzyme synthetase and biotin operon repressor [Legionella waltersii]
MYQFNSSQLALMNLLSDGKCHTGNELGKAIGVSRSAIWKQINHLNELGVPVIHVQHKGYQLPKPIELLNAEKMTFELCKLGFKRPFSIQTFTEIDSTNRYLKDRPQSHDIDICCAEIQTHGKGRFGRQWHSPFGDNIYCSSRWNLQCDLGKLSGLSLITSLAVLASLKQLHLDEDIHIKWPNDILWNEKKLCGSLIEIIAETNGSAQVIIGVGLNVNLDPESVMPFDRPWCSLYEIYNKQFDRNFIIANLLTVIERYIDQFMNSDLNYFLNEWKQVDYLYNQAITVSQSTGSITGIAKGINQFGQLIVVDTQGNTHYLSSGDTSLSSAMIA